MRNNYKDMTDDQLRLGREATWKKLPIAECAAQLNCGQHIDLESRTLNAGNEAQKELDRRVLTSLFGGLNA